MGYEIGPKRGVANHYGPRETDNQFGGQDNTNGKIKSVSYDFDFDKEWRAKEDITRKVKTITPEVIYQAISQVTIETKHKSARLKAFNELEAIGFWLLMFSMRGMY